MAEVIEHFQGKKKKVDNDKKKPDGKKTVGIGFDMKQPDARKIWQKVLPCVPFDDVLSGKRCLEEAEIQKLFQHTLKEKIKIAKRLFPKFDSYPDDVKTALVNGVFHGDFNEGHKTVKLINEGKWDKVADEYLDRIDYKNCERNGLPGIKKRLDWNADIFRKYAEKLKKNRECDGHCWIKKFLDWIADIFRKYAEKSKKKP